MGQALDKDGNVLGEAYGKTKREVFEELDTKHPDAEKILIQKVHERALVANIARVCHEANRAYCLSLDDTSQPSWVDAPGWQRESAYKGVEGIISGRIRGPEDSHLSWSTEKRDQGWVYGEVKDAVAKTHPRLVVYEDLPESQRKKDAMFFAIVNALKV